MTITVHADADSRTDAWLSSALRGARRHVGKGTRPEFLADTEPPLAADALGIGYADLSTGYHGAGEDDAAFSWQSLTKVFALALALGLDGERLWRKVGFRAVEQRYDTIAGLDRPPVPPNPLFNAGALVVVDRLITHTGGAAEAVRDFVREQAHDDAIDIDPATARAELERSHRNRALVYVLADVGLLDNPPEDVLRQYVEQCALRASCRQLATAALFLARTGRNRRAGDGLPPRQVRRINSLLTLSGTYDASAANSFRIGLPMKSGVGGGMLAVLPGLGAVAAWSPGLDPRGNSRAGLRAIEIFSRLVDGA